MFATANSIVNIVGDPLLSTVEKTKLGRFLGGTSDMITQVKEDLAFMVTLLSDTDPVTGQVQLDSITFSEVFELYEQFNADCAVLPSRAHVHSVWEVFLDESGISIRDRKTVSKCDKCVRLRDAIRRVRKIASYNLNPLLTKVAYRQSYPKK